jgi:regulator of protease activity HflC (stomatin/prohibitin superfamily)
MSTKDNDPIHSRLPVTLRVSDHKLIVELRYAMEKRTGITVSLADIVREALRTQAAKENIECK